MSLASIIGAGMIVSGLVAAPLPIRAESADGSFHPLPSGTPWDGQAGQGVQRTLRALESSGPNYHPTVRILFYGQSITEQPWWNAVADDLRARYPHADLQIENRALGGFASQLLKQTAHADLYPFYPDLLIFHVYGSSEDYEEIIRETRHQTTSEILLQTDHLTSPADLVEETEPARLSKAQWNSWFPNAFVPGLADACHTGLVPQRNLWKRYLKENGLQPSDLLKDGVHLNAHGVHLMGEIVKAHLVRRPVFDSLIPFNGTIREWVIGRDVTWKDGVLDIPFEGNRVDLVAGAQASGEVEVLLDGKHPSAFPELYGFGRTSKVPGTSWPAIRQISSRTPLVRETWSARIFSISPDGKSFHFDIEGSVTGPDGSGLSTEPFVSSSGRVVIHPAAWSLDYAIAVFKKPLEPFTVTWEVEQRFLDRVLLTPDRPGGDQSALIAQGLVNGPHRLVLRAAGTADPVLHSVRVHTPPMP